MRILVATNNHHKLAEYQEILTDYELVTPADLDIRMEVEETGTTFQDNALLKARAVAELLKQDRAPAIPILADDSGLCVNALGGRPGVYSARYGSPDGGATELPSPERNALLLKEMQGLADRQAYFVCAIALLLPLERSIMVQETWQGAISERPSGGATGFGYDPVFVVDDDGRTAADLEPSEKNRLSHRGRATSVIRAALAAAKALPEVRRA